MQKLLLIAEKPSLMRDLQAVYKTHRKEIPYLIDFTALSGHICGLAQPNDYSGWEGKWQDVPLPLIPETWQIKVLDTKKDMYKKIRDMIKNGNYDGYICATDADREGNLIFHLLETKMKLKGTILRLWVHDLTEPAILDSFKQMVPLHTDAFQRHLTDASVLRSKMDWLVGMNATRAATLRSGMLMNVGRVKAPTLKLVYDNSMAIANFKPSTSYGVETQYAEGFPGSLFDGEKIVYYEKKAEAEAVLKQLGNTARVEKLTKEKKQQAAPQLYKLSDLQIDANKQFGYSPEETLSLVQSLYETHKLVSYPRCDCRYISTELAKKAHSFIDAILSIPELTKAKNAIQNDRVTGIISNKRYVNDTEVNKNSHTALMPTGLKPDMSKLPADERNILLMIYKRFLSLFLKPIEYEKTTVITDNNGYKFQTSGRIILEKGFSALFEKDLSETVLPTLKEGQILPVQENNISEKTTTPPKRLTEGDLIKAMEEISKYIDDKKLKTVMKDTKGIGTPATRGAIISELIKGGFIESRTTKKVAQLYISDTGKSYIENLKNFDIVSPERTAIWESELKSVEQGEMDSAVFEKEMLDFTKDITKQIMSASMNRPALQREVVGVCPRCGRDVVEGKQAYGCIGYKCDPPCKFTIWKSNKLLESQGKRLTKAMVKSLLKSGKCSVKGLTSAKSGKKYDADFYLDDTGTWVNLKMEFSQKKK